MKDERKIAKVNGAEKKPSCATCAFFTSEGQMQVGAGFCRVYPPRVFVVGMTQAAAPVSATAWPSVQESQWCGEHEYG